MRERVLFEVVVRRFAVWRVAVASIAMAAVAAPIAWAVSRAGSSPPGDAVLSAALAALLVALTLAVAISISRNAPVVLACRDGAWSFAAEGSTPRAGTLVVTIDVGSFMLLRLNGATGGRLWLPVQRRGLEREWHALRCAAYSPPPSTPAPIEPALRA
jgi:hypothetical protein